MKHPTPGGLGHQPRIIGGATCSRTEKLACDNTDHGVFPFTLILADINQNTCALTAVLAQATLTSNMSATKALALLSLLGLASCQTTVGFGPYFSLGPTSSWIREATTTLVLPDTPSPQKDRLALWPGMGTSGGDLIQALAVSFADPAAYAYILNVRDQS
jgi:hypothetical protein